MKKQLNAVALFVTFVALLFVAHATAQTPLPQPGDTGPGFVMLDRDSMARPATPYQPAERTHMSPMATLSHTMAGPGVTMVSIGFFPIMAPTPIAFIGNFYTAPADFPTSYYPFFVTGAFAFGTGPPTMNVLGAGVAPAPFPIGTMMWAAFATAPFPGPPAMTSGILGAPGIFPHSPPTVAVPTGLGVACGLLSDVGVAAPGVGALAFVATPRPFRVSFVGPPVGAMDFLATATFVLPNAVVAGCFISGATVPVELQAYSVE